MKKIKLTLALNGRHGVTSLPWEGWEYPEMPGLEGIRLAAIRIPIWNGDAFVPDTEDWKLTDVIYGKDFYPLVTCWPTKDKLMEKALPVLLCYADQIREKVKEHGTSF